MAVTGADTDDVQAIGYGKSVYDHWYYESYTIVTAKSSGNGTNVFGFYTKYGNEFPVNKDGSLTMGNLMNAAASLGVASCWINRAMEVFDKEEGKALLRKWGIDEKYRGVGHCILGYADGEWPAPKPRKEGRIFRP